MKFNHIKKLLPLLFLLLLLLLLSGCAKEFQKEESLEKEFTTGPDWRTGILTDVKTGEEFSFSDFKGKSILIESFAVWCPTCLEQQRQIDKMREIENDNVVHISINTDPNEDEEKVREHIAEYGFDWYFAVSPIEVTQDLIDDFGLKVVNAPSAPVILVCEDQSARLLRNGVKSPEDLNAEIEKGC